MLKITLTLPALVLGFIFTFFGDITQKNNSKDEITICHNLASENMAQFAMDPTFQALHPSPQNTCFRVRCVEKYR